MIAELIEAKPENIELNREGIIGVAITALKNNSVEISCDEGKNKFIIYSDHHYPEVPGKGADPRNEPKVIGGISDVLNSVGDKIEEFKKLNEDSKKQGGQHNPATASAHADKKAAAFRERSGAIVRRVGGVGGKENNRPPVPSRGDKPTPPVPPRGNTQPPPLPPRTPGKV